MEVWFAEYSSKSAVIVDVYPRNLFVMGTKIVLMETTRKIVRPLPQELRQQQSLQQRPPQQRPPHKHQQLRQEVDKSLINLTPGFGDKNDYI